MKLFKKILSMLLVVILILPRPVMVQATEKNQDQAIAWVQSIIGTQRGSGQCVELIKDYYNFLGAPTPFGNGRDYATNDYPEELGWSRVQGGQPQKGDILVYEGYSENPYGHVAIYESDKVTYHQNFNNHKYVEKITTIQYNKFYTPYWGYIRPNWNGTSSGGGDNPAPVVVEPYANYEYKLSKDDKGNQVATITKYDGNMTDLTIPDKLDGYTVACIGGDVFKGAGMKSVTIPDTVTSIGGSAFSGCTGLQTVKLSKNLEKMGEGVFYNCTNLTGIEIPKALKECEWPWNVFGTSGIFEGCINLKGVSFESGITTIPAHLLEKCSGIQEVEIPDTVTTIEGEAFSGCVNMVSVNIPDMVKEIQGLAFSGCVGLQAVKLSKNLEKMGEGVFYNCTSLTGIEIPRALKECEWPWNVYGTSGIFEGCINLKNVTFESGRTAIPAHLLENCSGIQEVEIPDTVTTIEGEAFSGCVNMVSVNIPDTVTEIHGYAFSGCTGLQTVKLSNNLIKMGESVFNNCRNLSAITIPKTLKECEWPWSTYGPQGIFKGCIKLKNVTFESGTTAIPANILRDCSGVEKIVLPDTVNIIEGCTFTGCTSLVKVTIPTSVKKMGNSVFEDCTALPEITIPDSVTEMGEYIFKNCSSLTKATLPSNRKDIVKQMFYGCSSLKEITLPESVKYIRESAFENSGLTKLTVPDRVSLIGANAFKNNAALTDVTLGKSVTLIREGAFDLCGALKSINIPDKTAVIGRNAFRNCDSLSAIDLPDSVVSVGDYAFAENTALQDVKLGSNITKLPTHAFFEDPAIASIAMPGKLAEIGDFAFGNCTGLKEITIPKSVTKIADNAFSYPEKMKINGVVGSYAQDYAKGKSISFNSIPEEKEPTPAEKPVLKMDDTFRSIQDGWWWEYDADGNGGNDGKLTPEQQDQATVNTGDFDDSRSIEYNLKCVETLNGDEQEYQMSVDIYDDNDNYISFGTNGRLWNGGTGRSRNTGENTKVNFALSVGDIISVKMTKTDNSYHMELSKNNEVMLNMDAKESNLTGDIHTRAIAHFGDFQCAKASEKAPDIDKQTEISPKTDSGLVITDGTDKNKQLTGLKAGTNTVKDVSASFSNSNLVFTSVKGEVLTESDNVGTGTVISIKKDDKTVDSVTVIISGDINGDGEIGTMDITMMARSLVGTLSLSAVQKQAGDLISDSKVNNKDINKLLKVIAGSEQPV